MPAHDYDADQRKLQFGCVLSMRGWLLRRALVSWLKRVGLLSVRPWILFVCRLCLLFSLPARHDN